MRDLAIKLEEKNHQTEFEQEYRRFPVATDSPKAFHEMAKELHQPFEAMKTCHRMDWWQQQQAIQAAFVDVIVRHTFSCSVQAIPPYWKLTNG